MLCIKVVQYVTAKKRLVLKYIATQESRGFFLFKLIPVQNWVGWVRATTFQIGMA